ncbi:MAG: hypothetical protein NUV53_01660 [Patescibacteria group bacterium]|nr:hypothetical protein [Patescibacteria group bacterium]
METGVPTITETKKEIIIRIPKGWRQGGRSFGVEDVLRIAREGTREFRRGETRTFETFLTTSHPLHARGARRSR